jgi:aminodeoxyfutalosine deaminase
MLLRARNVLPLCAPPIEDGAVLIRGERIEAVGRWKDLQNSTRHKAVDLGDSILLPGLINAHCHLDYTGMAGQLMPGKNFSDWIKGIVALKAAWSYTEFANSWVNGANMLLRSGTTTVVDIEAVPELLPEVTTSTPLRVISCLELLSVRSRHSAIQLVEAAVSTLQVLPAETGGLSPHAPYSTSPELLRAAASVARHKHWLLTTHVAESADEFEMYRHAHGAMFEWLRSQRDMRDCDGRSPVQHLARCDALGPNLLAVHANYLAQGDAELMSRSGASVVHCPRSHAFFGHEQLPLDSLAAAGVNICLGTDSMATMPKSRAEPLALNMFSEMRTFAARHRGLSAQRVLEMGTLDAAKAIGRSGELGAIAPGACADLIVVALPAHGGDLHEAVLQCRNDVAASMIRGEWAVAPAS